MIHTFVLLALLVVVKAQDPCSGFDANSLDPTQPADLCSTQLARGGIPVGNMCLIPPSNVIPTQSVYGQVDADCERAKLEKYSKSRDGSLKSYLASKPAPGLLGPNGAVYITDHHHLAKALLEASFDYTDPESHRLLYFCNTNDLSNLSISDFWTKMLHDQNVWLYGTTGNPIQLSDLPISVKYLKDDPMRSLSEYVRDSFGYVKCTPGMEKKFPQCNGVTPKPFLEFRWGNYLRSQLNINSSLYVESIQAQVRDLKLLFQPAVKSALSAPSNMEGFNQRGYTSLVSIDSNGCE